MPRVLEPCDRRRFARSSTATASSTTSMRSSRAYLDAAVERHLQAGLSREAAMRAARIELGSTDRRQGARARGGLGIAAGRSVAGRALRPPHAATGPGLHRGCRADAGARRSAPTPRSSASSTACCCARLPVAAPGQLAVVSTNSAIAEGYPAGFNYPVWEQIREQSKPIGHAVAWTVFPTRLDLAQGGESDLVDGLFVSGNFFDELGVVPRRGTHLRGVRGPPGKARQPRRGHQPWPVATTIRRRCRRDRSIAAHRASARDSHRSHAAGVLRPGSRPCLRRRDAARIGAVDPERRQAGAHTAAVRISPSCCDWPPVSRSHPPPRSYEACIGRSSPRRCRRSRSGVSTKKHN